MNGKLKAILISAVAVGAIAIYLHYKKSSLAPVKNQPTYTVMGKKFSDSSAKIEYDLFGEGGEVIAECTDPKSDGTGCEKFKTMQSYVFDKDASGRFLIERTAASDGPVKFSNESGVIRLETNKVHLRIKSEGYSTGSKDDADKTDHN